MAEGLVVRAGRVEAAFPLSPQEVRHDRDRFLQREVRAAFKQFMAREHGWG